MAPSPGRIVHYHLTAADVRSIQEHRGITAKPVGSPVKPGDTFPAMCTRPAMSGGWTEKPKGIGLKVFLDGYDVHWVPEAEQSHEDEQEHGTWSWPPRMA